MATTPNRRDISQRSMTGLLACVLASGCAASAPRDTASSLPPVTGEIHSQSGIRYVDVVEGTGAAVARLRCVYAHYTGWLADGTQIESSRVSPTDATVPTPVGFVKGAGKVMAGWEAGFEGMRVGGTRRLFIPSRLAYGANGNPPRVPPRADLVFDVDVIAVHDAERSECPPLRY